MGGSIGCGVYGAAGDAEKIVGVEVVHAVGVNFAAEEGIRNVLECHNFDEVAFEDGGIGISNYCELAEIN